MDSFMGRIGGKKRLRDEIISRFPNNIPDRYIEVFGGAGWVLFRKEKYPKQLEVFNDLDDQLINLFRCIKYHDKALQQELEWLPSSRTIFNANQGLKRVRKTAQKSRECKYVANKSHQALLRCLRQ